MTTTPKIGRTQPSPEQTKVPYIVNLPGNADDVLVLNEDVQPEWSAPVGSILPSGGEVGDALVTGPIGNLEWSGEYVARETNGSFGTGIPAQIGLPRDLKYVSLRLLFLGLNATSLGWTLDFYQGTGSYDYTAFGTSPPVAGATVVSGASVITIPAFGPANPLVIQTRVDLSTAGSYHFYELRSMYWNAVGDVEQYTVNGYAPVGTISRINLAGSLVVGSLSYSVIGT